MNHLTADEAMLARLRGIVEPVEIRAPDSRMVGRYTPVLSPEEADFYARVHEFFDLPEAEPVAATEGDGYTIEEVMQYLHSLPGPGAPCPRRSAN